MKQKVFFSRLDNVSVGLAIFSSMRTMAGQRGVIGVLAAMWIAKSPKYLACLCIRYLVLCTT